MAHYALLNTQNVVVNIFVGRDDAVEGIDDWEDYYSPAPGRVVKKTSYNTIGGVHYTTDDEGNRAPSDDQSKALRFNFAGIGYTYDEARDAFIPPKLFDSWVLDEGTCLWVAPVPMPDDADTVSYTWDEEAGAWVAAPEDAVE